MESMSNISGSYCPAGLDAIGCCWWKDPMLNYKYLKRKKKLKGKKLVVGILGTALLCAINGATVKKIFFMKMVVQIYFMFLTQLKGKKSY